MITVSCKVNVYLRNTRDNPYNEQWFSSVDEALDWIAKNFNGYEFTMKGSIERHETQIVNILDEVFDRFNTDRAFVQIQVFA